MMNFAAAKVGKAATSLGEVEHEILRFLPYF
jgi:hypothetical protein